jgi:serine/threonine-protein kinase
MPTDRTTIDAQALFERGHESFQSGDFREAVECFSRAIRLRPNVAAGYRYRALAHLEMGNRLDALNDFDAAIRLKSDDPLLYAERARLLFRQQAFDAAVTDCDKALALDPGLAPVYGLRGDCFAANGESGKAFDDFARAIASDPENAADYRLSRAELHLELEEYDSALRDADAAVQLSPESGRAFQTRGLIYRAMGDAGAADRDFSRTLDLDPDRVLARLARATVRLGQKRYAAAVADCDVVVKAAPTMGKAFEVRGLCRKSLGDDPGALADFTEAIKLNPNAPLPYNLRAGVHYHQGRYQKAIQDHLAALQRDPQDAGTFNQLAWIWATAPDPDVRNGGRAKECGTRACELSEWGEPSYLDTLAAAYAELGEFDEAVKWMEKAMEKVSAEAEDDYRSRLDLYQDGKPVRVTPQ